MTDALHESYRAMGYGKATTVIDGGLSMLDNLALAQRRLGAMQEILRRIKVHLERGGRISRSDRDLLLASIDAHLAREALP